MSDTTIESEKPANRIRGWVMFWLLFIGSIGIGSSLGMGAGIGAFCLTLFLNLGIEWTAEKFLEKPKDA